MGSKGRKRDRAEFEVGAGAEGSSKRKRQVTDEKRQLYKLYEDLAAESDEVRLKAAQEFIVKFSPENHPTASDLQEVLNRLIRGLCTQRKAARIGFCVTLTELLRQLLGPSKAIIEGLDLNVDSFLKRVERQTKVEGNVAGVERRDHLIGKLFAYKAIMQSSVLLEPQVLLEGWNELLDRIYGMARNIPWLREECGLILVQAIETLDSKPGVESCAQGLVQRLVSYNLVNTPEGVAIWLALKASTQKKVLPVKVWHDNDPLSKKERSRLAKVLRENFRSSEDGKSEGIKSAAAHANPSFAWDLLLSKVLQIDANVKEDRTDPEKSEFSRFWLDTVDAHLFGNTSSHERKSWGFKIFAKMIGQVPDWALPALFSPNLMRTLLNQTKKEDRFLHAAALHAWKALPCRAQQAPSSAPSLIVGLTSKNGTADFDGFIKAKTLEQIILEADDDSLRKIVRHLHSLILRPETAEQSVADHRRQNIADLLLGVVRQYKRYGEFSSDVFEKDNWLRNSIELIVEHAYFAPSQSAKTRKVPLPPISESGRKMFQERLSSCLTRLLTVKTESDTSFGLSVIQMIKFKATSSKTLKLLFEAEDSVVETVNNACRTLESVLEKNAGANQKSPARGFVLLYTFTLLQIYNGDTDAILMLEDIDTSRKAVLETTQTSVPKGQDGFVEILLSFLGNPRTLFHRIAIEAFTMFASELSPEGLQSLTDILNTEESLEGQKRLFAQEDDAAGEDEAESDEDMEDTSDVEMVDGETSGAEPDDSEQGSSSNAGSESDDGSDDDSEEDEELTQFNNMLALTLQTSKSSANGEAAEETSDESDMDDEQMMALDPHLSNIFKQRSQITGKKERKDAKKNIVQFKSRVLDLVAIFLDKQFSNVLTLDLLIPVVRLTRASANKQLSDKSAKLLKATFDTHTKQKTPLPKPNDIEAAVEVLKSIHMEAKLGAGAITHANACSSASLHLVRVLVGLNRENYGKVVDVYAESQKQWFTEKKTLLQPVLFSQFLNWSIQFLSSSAQTQQG